MTKLTYVLKKPIISEKSLDRAARGFYTFAVDIDANKEVIKKAIENQWKVNVISVKTLIKKGAIKRTGRKRIKTKTSRSKYAIAQLKPDQKIELFEVAK